MAKYSRICVGLLALVMVVAACNDQEVLISEDGTAEADTDHSEHEHWFTDSLDTRDAMARAFADGRHRFGPQDHSFEQVGLLIDGQLPEGLHYRVQTADGSWTQERPLEITWSEGEYHVARILLDEAAEQVELIGGQGIDRLFLEFYRERTANPDIITTELPLESEVAGSDDSDIATVEQALAPDSLVISRAQWGARHPNKVCGANHNPSRMSIHHTAQPSTDGPDPAARMRQMQAFHIDNRGWCDLGYHFVVSQSGKIYQGRSSARRTGAHVGGQNSSNVGISLIGNFQNQVPGQAQLDATVDIMRWVHQTFSVPLNADRTRGHQQWPGQSTACPGTHVLSRLDELRQRAAQPADQPAPPPEEEEEVVDAQVSFISPVDGATIPNPATFEIEATGGVATVQIEVDDWPLSQPFDPRVTNPFTYDFVGTGFQRKVVLKGYSAAGSVVASQTINITVSDGAVAPEPEPEPVEPRVAFTSPGDGATVSNPVTFHFQAEGVHRVQIKADDWPLADEPWDPAVSTSHSFSFMGTGFTREVVLYGYAADGSVLTRDTIEVTVQD